MDAGGTATTECPPNRGSEWKHESPDFSRGESQQCHQDHLGDNGHSDSINLSGHIASDRQRQPLGDVFQFSESPDLAVGPPHVACMLVCDLVESAVLYRSRHVMRLGWILISLAVATVRLSVIVFAIQR